MKKVSIGILSIILICMIQNVSAQIDDTERKLQMELEVTDEQKIILFSGFAIAVIGLFVYLARDIILRKKTTYDDKEFDSKNDKTYEKYHSDWSDDYEEIGTRKNSKEDKEFRRLLQDPSLPDYYKILDVSHNATLEEIKKQYRIMAKKIHPDKNKEEKSDEAMVQINKAYEILSNEELRKKYDIHLNKD
ncbi:MAG: DnaJ domain-containing protein [Nitrosarchaeum sp.]|nr:DnaJ domain-containing protein [Nitrosarchaeum sp.]